MQGGSLKANNVDSRGFNPRNTSEIIIGPERARRSRDGLSQIFFIELDPGFDQRFAQFITEGQLLVVLRLAFDVFDHRVFVAVRHRKRPVTILPMREIRKQGVVFDPCAGADLDVLHQIGEGNGWVKARQNVNVVFHAVNAVEVTIFVLQDAHV